MAQTTKTVALNATTATLLCAANQRRTAVYFRNEDETIVVRVGPSTVTKAGTAATAGIGLAGGEVLPFVSGPGESGAGEAWYGISESGTPSVGVCEIVG